MFIQTEQTPNPQTLKFLPGKVVMEDGTAFYQNLEEPGQNFRGGSAHLHVTPFN